MPGAASASSASVGTLDEGTGAFAKALREAYACATGDPAAVGTLGGWREGGGGIEASSGLPKWPKGGFIWMTPWTMPGNRRPLGGAAASPSGRLGGTTGTAVDDDDEPLTALGAWNARETAGEE